MYLLERYINYAFMYNSIFRKSWSNESSLYFSEAFKALDTNQVVFLSTELILVILARNQEYKLYCLKYQIDAYSFWRETKNTTYTTYSTKLTLTHFGGKRSIKTILRQRAVVISACIFRSPCFISCERGSC